MCAPARSGRWGGWRTRSCAGSVPAVHEADEDLPKRTLAGIEVLEVDAVRGQPAQQVGDAGFLGLGVEGVDQRLAIVGQLERQRGQLVWDALERRLQRQGQLDRKRTRLNSSH